MATNSSSKMVDVVFDMLQKQGSKTSLNLNHATPSETGREKLNSTASLFKMAAEKTLKLRKQSQLNLQDHIHKFGADNLLIGSNKPSTDESEESDEDQDSMKDIRTSCGIAFHVLSPSQIEDVCYDALKLFHDLEPLQTDQDNKAIFHYIKQVFNVTEEKFASCDNAAKQKATKERVLILKCKLVKANGLPAKDANGKSDPYCLIGILDKEHIDSKVVRNNNLQNWHEQQIISKIYRSSVKEETLDPEWNETFELEITNPQDQYLVVELWDSDEAQKSSVKGFKGFGRLLADLKKEDDFLGRVFFLLQHSPVGGGERTFDVLSHSGKHSRGTLTVWLDIAKKKEAKSEHEAHSCYKQLLQCIMEAESKKDSQEYTRHWNAILPPIAEKLLTQYCSLHRITPLQQSALRLSVLLDYNKAYAIDITALLDVLQNIQHYEAEIPDSERSIKGTPVQDFTDGTSGPPSWVLTLINNLQEIATYILDLMKNHFSMFNLKSDDGIKQLKTHLQVLHEVYQIRLFKAQQRPEGLDYRRLLTSAIQAAVPQWILILSGNLMPPHSGIEENMLAFKALCAHCLKQCERGYNKICPVFMEVGVDYFSPFFTSLDKLLHSEVESRFEFEEDNPDIVLVTYEIYRIFQELVVFANYVNSEFLVNQGLTKLAISSYHLWFKTFLSKWIHIAQYKAKDRLLKAIELDTIVKYTDRASFSSSAVDAHAFFLQVISFWNDLKWPDREESLGYFVTVVQNLCELSTYYAELMFHKIKPEYYIDKDGRFIVTDKLCITLNNIHHVKQVLKNIETELDLPAYYKWLDEEKTVEGPKLSEHARTLIVGVLDSADEDMFNKIDSIVKIIKEKLSPSILAFLPGIMEASDDMPSEKVLEPLLDYIATNMGKLGQALLTPIFLSIMKDIWLDIINELKGEYMKLSHKSAVNRQNYKRLRVTLTTLGDFFEADGNGLSRTELETEDYTTLLDDLSLSVLSTEDIIKKFCHDLVKQQVLSKDQFGVLHLSHVFDSTKKALVVEVISADHIPGLDRSGKSDPYVQLYLLPATVFTATRDKTFKTTVQKQTLDPIFNETFELTADPSKLKQDGSILLLAMYDHDTFGSDDFAGICVVSCNATPLEGGERKMEHLNLFHYKQSFAFNELENRIAEPIAHDFLKTMKKFVFEGETNADHPFHRIKASFHRSHK